MTHGKQFHIPTAKVAFSVIFTDGEVETFNFSNQAAAEKAFKNCQIQPSVKSLKWVKPEPLEKSLSKEDN